MRARNHQGLTTARCAVSAALVVALSCLGAYGCGSNAGTAGGSDAAAAKETQVEQQSAEQKAEEKTEPKTDTKTETDDEAQAAGKTDDATQQTSQDTQATQAASEPASEASMTMDRFPREWNGTYRGTSDNGDGPVSEWRTLYLEIDSTSPDGSFEGICHVDGDLAYYCAGKVDLTTRAVSIWGTEWIEQGDLIYMCRFDGDVTQDWHTMGGTKEALGGDPHPGPWELHA
ncbi:MAG: hypothetical protein Q4A01_07940 [Coriobacteriales bacterium]|nr:hypothetical protein [Coriobacteriales bacterium]